MNRRLVVRGKGIDRPTEQDNLLLKRNQARRHFLAKNPVLPAINPRNNRIFAFFGYFTEVAAGAPSRRAHFIKGQGPIYDDFPVRIQNIKTRRTAIHSLGEHLAVGFLDFEQFTGNA